MRFIRDEENITSMVEQSLKNWDWKMEIEATCYHEAGHAVAGYLSGLALASIWIEEDAGGVTNFIPGSRLHLRPNSRIEDERIQEAILVCLTGAAAETRARANRTNKLVWNSHGYRKDALHLLAKVVWFCNWKLPRKGYSIDDFYKDFGGPARALVWKTQIWAAITALAEALIDKKELSGQEAVRIIEAAYGNSPRPEKALPMEKHGNGQKIA